jgi:hypothetical protein
MAEQFENPAAEKLEDLTDVNAKEEKNPNEIAEKAAEKPARTEKKFDKDNSSIFSK